MSDIEYESWECLLYIEKDDDYKKVNTFDEDMELQEAFIDSIYEILEDDHIRSVMDYENYDY